MNTSFNVVTEKEFLTDLEKVMDSKGLNYILMQLANICNEKSIHIAENWQDRNLAKQWQEISDKLDKFRLKNEKTIF